ncbi:MAG: hypothetical protein NTU86_08790 [Burkholderiales bacterium]|nr:hypothetical protein [Burkholderiales bacterium]
MITTTLRIEQSLHDRIVRLARASHQTPQTFMVEALAQKADEVEWRICVGAQAQQRDLRRPV